jgi:TfoX/Sxy family transcriptional regulator of competence genes
MAWVKIPAENHPLFLAALPKDPRVSTVQMFGGVGALVNGNMFGGLFARSALVKLAERDQREALAIDGSQPFDPMGNGRVMKDTVLLGESIMDDAAALRGWLQRALDYTATLPPKKTAGAKAPAKAAKQPAKAPTKPAARARAAKRPAAARSASPKKTPRRAR